MRKYLSIALILAVLPSALAASETVFGGWVYANALYKTASGLNFSVSPNDDYSKLAFSFQKSGGAIVEKGDCRSSGGMVLCYEDFAFSHYNYSLPDRVVNEYRITVEVEVAAVNFTRSFSTLSPEIGELVYVSSFFQNNGAVASEFYFEDAYPGNFEVFLTTLKCDKVGNAIAWRGVLSSGQSASCSYIIKPKNASTFASGAFIEFESNGKKKETHSAAIAVSDYAVQGSLNISQNLTMGSTSIIPIKLVSASDVTDVLYSASFPSGMNIMSFNSSQGGSRAGNRLEYSGKLAKGIPVILSPAIRAEGVGSQEIIEDFSFSKGNSSLNYQKSSRVFISHEKPYLRAAPEKSGEMHFFAVNPGILVQNLTVSLESNITLSAKEIIIAEVPQGGHRDFFIEIEPKPANHSILWKMKYQTKYGSYSLSEGIIFVEGTSSLQEAAEKGLPAQPPASENSGKSNVSAEKADEVKPLVKIRQRAENKVSMLIIIAPVAFMLLILLAFLLIRRRHSQV